MDKTDQKVEEKVEEKNFLSIIHHKNKWLFISLTLDGIINSSLLWANETHFNPHFATFLAMRQLLGAIFITAEQAEYHMIVSIAHVVFTFKLLAMCVLSYFVLFSDGFWNWETWSLGLSSFALMTSQFYLLTQTQIKYRMALSRKEWREDKKAKGQLEKLRKDDEREKEKENTHFLVVFRKLIVKFKPFQREAVITLIGVIGCEVLSNVMPVIDARVLDCVVAKDPDGMQRMVLFRALITIVQSCFHYTQAYYQRVTRELVERELRLESCKAALRCETGYFDEKNSGEVFSVAYHNVGRATCELGWNIRCFAELIIRTCVVVFVIFTIDVRIALASLLISPMMQVSMDFFNKHCERISRLNRDNWQDCETMLSEAIQNIRTVKVFGTEDFEFSLYKEQLMEAYEVIMESVWYCETRWAVSNCLPRLSSCFVFYFGMQLAMKDELSIGQLSALMSYQGTITWCFHSVAQQMSWMNRIMVQSYKVFKLLERDCELKRTGSEKPKECVGEVVLRNVHFSYPTKEDKKVLNGVDLRVNPGEVVAIVGESGCGKSTIVKLMSFLYGAEKGEVLLDGIPVGAYDAKCFSNRVVSVPQEPVLFARSIHDNISYGKVLSRGQVEHAARMANAHEFIMKLDRGYDSVVGERGLTLSGGQRQRICIARALSRSPNVLLLDEATASLDSTSEHMVHKAIDDIIENEKRCMSLVIVAHRLSTVMNADRIYVIKEGRVAEEGSHETLMNAGGGYSEFVMRQMLNEAVKKKKTELKMELTNSLGLIQGAMSPQKSA